MYLSSHTGDVLLFVRVPLPSELHAPSDKVSGYVKTPTTQVPVISVGLSRLVGPWGVSREGLLVSVPPLPTRGFKDVSWSLFPWTRVQTCVVPTPLLWVSPNTQEIS